MVGCILLMFLAGLELFCLSIGAGLFEAEVSREVRRLWIQSLWSIPLTGLAAVCAMSRRARKRIVLVAVLACLFGAAASGYWAWQTVVNKLEAARLEGSLIASLALAPSLLLLSAGLTDLFRRSPSSGDESA